MSSLRKLPRAGTWEIGLMQAPGIAIQDVELLGMLLVVEQSGLVRMATPITERSEVAGAVKRAARTPAGGTEAARPRTLVCTPDLRFALNSVARSLGAKLKVADALPLVDEAMTSLLEHFSEGAPLVPEDAQPWRAVMAELLREHPWETLSDSVLFRFRHSGPLDDAVVVVLGMLGEQLGLVLYPEEEDHRLFLDMADSGRPDPSLLHFWCAHLDPVEELPESHALFAEKLGLVQEGLALQVYSVDGGETLGLETDEEQAMLAAVQGVLGAWRTHRARLALDDTTTRVPTVLGELEVRSSAGTINLELPYLPEPLILEVDHQLILTTMRVDGEELPGLTLKMAKRDARRLARILDERHEVDAISIEEVGDHVDVVAWDGDLEVGVLARFPHQAGLWDQWRELGRGALIVSGGGAKRRSLREQDAILLLHVDLIDPSVQDHPLIERGILDGASWEGPADEWPRASTVLLDFAEPLRVAEMSTQQAQEALHFAAMVWSTVVLADHAGQEALLETTQSILGAGEHGQILHQLIQRKRSLYPKDNRIMQVESLTRSKGRMDLRVTWTEIG